VEEAVAGERELGEEEQLDALGAGLGDPLQMALEVLVDLAEAGVDLRQADSNARSPLGHGEREC